MAKIKGIVDRIPKKKMIDISTGLRTLYARKEVVQLQRDFLVDNYLRYKRLYEENLACDKSNESLEAGNAWGVKDTKTVLKEKNTLIFQYEKEIAGLREQIASLKEDEPKKFKENVKMVTISFPDQVNYLYEEIGILNESMADKERESREIVLELENKILELQKAVVRAEEAANNVTECRNRNALYDTLAVTEALQKVENENLLLKGTIKNFEQKLYFQDKENKHNKMELEQREKATKMVEMRLEEAGELQKTLSGDEYMIEEIKSVSEAYENITKENTKLIEQINYLNRKNREIEMRLVENQTKAKLTEKNMETTARHVKEIEKLMEAIETARNTHIEKYGTVEEELAHKTATVNELSNAVRVYKRDLGLVEKSAEDKVTTIYAQLNEIKELREKSAGLEKKAKTYEATVNAYEKAFRDNSTTVDLHMQIQDLKEYVYCALCKSNLKTHVIDTCMHCFCEECLEHRLRTRSRFCPKCNQEYSRSDIKRVYL
ncbi:BRE1 [Enterospora canceri]|uniref:E3 ubiquitin protein ligase n=1 Tax=Enterospora canceri TaxID=1081671 RepID=A0A1Y1SAE3_9MICR|nr:BRE1 [Enterospora canceri]